MAMSIYDGVMGLVVGDALGVPFEFKSRDSFRATDMTGYGTYNQPSGTWSDDSSLTLATLESMSRLGRIDLSDIMRNFYKWLYHGFFTPYGDIFDVGRTTRAAIVKSNAGTVPPELCGGISMMDNGNGSLMRILPAAYYPGSLVDVINLSKLTHAHNISITACVIYTTIAKKLISGSNKQQAIQEGLDAIRRTMDIPQEFNRIFHIERLKRTAINSSGYVVDTLEAALWCFVTSDSYKECVLKAVNLGEDTDTIAAVAGGLAGIYYGIGGKYGIPEEWIGQIAKNEWIADLCNEFESKFN